MKYALTLLIIGLGASFVFAQDILKGSIKNENGEPILGASISIDGTTTSTTTDVDGNFQLQLTTGYETIIIIAEGYLKQKFYLTGENFLTISLISTSKNSGKEINFGIGSQPKNKLTSSVSSIDEDDIIKAPLPNLEQANQGVTAGLLVQNSSGKLGEDTQVRIRGGSSLLQSNNPLYVVDGVPLASGNQSNINPSNIESIQVLKDASASAIYGTRAANGVIVITTKDGNRDKMKVNIDYQYGISETPKKLNLFSSDDHRKLVYEFTVRDAIRGIEFAALSDGIFGVDIVPTINGQPQAFNTDFINNNFTDYENLSFIDLSGQFNILGFNRSRLIDSLDNVPDTDWQDEFFRTASSHQLNVDLQGGNDNFGYFASLGYNSQEGILIGNDFERINGFLSVENSSISNLDISFNLNYFRTNERELKDNQDLAFPLQGILLPPTDNFNPNNNFELFVYGGRGFYNPLTELNFSDNDLTNQGFVGSLSTKYSFSDNLSLNVDLGGDFGNVTSEQRFGPETLEGGFDGLSRIRTEDYRNYLFNGWLNYSLAKENNVLDVTLGGSYQNFSADLETKQAFVNNISTLESLDESLVLNNPIQGSANALVSAFSKVSYSINNKYSFEISGRMDGSSKFSEENRFGFFPAVSTSWTLSNEEFLASIDAINFMKLRASYGIVGNTPFEDFLYRQNYGAVEYNDTTGIELLNIANDELRWESTSQINFGIDFSFLRNRLSGSFDYYKKETSDLLFPIPVPPSTGFSLINDNVATLENSGWELLLSTENLRKGKLKWRTDFNISTNENKITNLEGQQAIVGVNAYLEGQPAGALFMREYAGVDYSDGSALYFFDPDNSDISISQADAFLIPDRFGDSYVTSDWESATRRVVGNPNPKYFGGITNTFNYGNFGFSFLVQFVQGIDMYFATGEFLANSGINLLNQLESQNDRWIAPGDQAAYPALDVEGNDPLPSTRWLTEGSYIRLKTITFTYDFPQSTLDRLKLDNLSLYVSGVNLFTITNYEGYDPDVNYSDPFDGQIGANISRGIDNFSIPQARIVSTGIKIGF